jgi:penicillin amidase
MKWLRRSLWILVILFVVLIGVSRWMSWMWGRDLDTLDIRSANYSFSASRDEESGVWNLNTDSPESLWFAMGYVQTWDREFQTELMRLAARGELARMLGEEVLANDRLMRFSARLARDEWNAASQELKTVARAFVEGRKEALKNPKLRQPFEYEILGLKREDFPEWEAQDVFALARFHSWQLSFDATLEALHEHLKSKVSPEVAHLLLPSEPKTSKPLYAQERLFQGSDVSRSLHRAGQSILLSVKSLAGISLPKLLPYFPPAEENSFFKAPQEGRASAYAALTGKASLKFDWDTQVALRGASNLWVLGDPRVGRALTLCNDTHLRFTWPASLYPVQYQIKDQIKASGFMLPGVPAIVIGTVEDQRESRAGDLLSWGITLASYGDTQDLVALSDAHARTHHRLVWESYPVRNLQNGRVEVRRFEETWTSYGPRVDGIYAELPRNEDRWLALDWVGFRRIPSPMEFFVRRNLLGREDLLKDLHARFAFPSFNFTWIEKEKNSSAYVGHLVTGWMRARRGREKDGLDIMEASQLEMRRTNTEPSQRPFFYREYSGQDPIFLVTANQKIWREEDLSSSLAHSWEPEDRALRIEASAEENIRESSYSMTDSFAPSLMHFYKGERARVSADRLCGGLKISSSRCVEWVSFLDRWQGKTEVDSWEATVVALWHAKFKAEIFMQLVPEEKRAELKAMMKDWHRRSYSAQALKRILSNKEGDWSESRWEALSGKKIRDLSIESFQWTLDTLVLQRGPDPRQWRWGTLHQISWLHPLVRAPEPWGRLFHESLLGPRPAVSGAVDSPGRFEYEWDMDVPLEFPATHGASLRVCSEFSKSSDSPSVKMKWAAPTGPSGNPFSIYSKAWSLKTFFKGKMSEVKW